MFVDYYQILEIDISATQAEIKSAFKKQAIKWHPDRNIGINTTSKMQDINEAYLILKDSEARKRYDLEYIRYKKYYSQRKKETENRQKEKYKQKEETNYNKEPESEPQYDYQFNDEILRNWMRNARKQAVNLAIQTIKEMGELSVTATKAAGSKIIEWTLGYVVSGFILFLIVKACSSLF